MAAFNGVGKERKLARCTCLSTCCCNSVVECVDGEKRGATPGSFPARHKCKLPLRSQKRLSNAARCMLLQAQKNNHLHLGAKARPYSPVLQIKFEEFLHRLPLGLQEGNSLSLSLSVCNMSCLSCAKTVTANLHANDSD